VHDSRTVCMKAPIHEIYDKSMLQTCRLQLCHYLHLFSCCCLPNLRNPTKFYKKFELIAVQGHPRSLILVSIKNAYATSYYSLIVTMDVSLTIFKILTHLARKVCFSTPPLLDTPSSGTPCSINVI